jgi:hypothetical protein
MRLPLHLFRRWNRSLTAENSTAVTVERGHFVCGWKEERKEFGGSSTECVVQWWSGYNGRVCWEVKGGRRVEGWESEGCMHATPEMFRNIFLADAHTVPQFFSAFVSHPSLPAFPQRILLNLSPRSTSSSLAIHLSLKQPSPTSYPSLPSSRLRPFPLPLCPGEHHLQYGDECHIFGALSHSLLRFPLLFFFFGFHPFSTPCFSPMRLHPRRNCILPLHPISVISLGVECGG